MELEQLEVLFKANYSDVIQKTQELASLFQNNFGQISSNVQNSLNQMANASNQNAQKIKQDSNDIVNAKRNEASQVNDAANSEHGAFSRISEAFQALKNKLANNNFDHTFDKLKQSAKKVEDTKIKAPEVDTSDLNKATRDVLKQVDTINQKMEQARREQAKLQKLMSMRTDVLKTDPDSLPKLDAQIDQQRVKMTRYLNQAKSLAQNMREEFDKIPASLEQIAGAMDRNEAAINDQKRLMASLRERIESTYDPNEIAKLQQAYDRQNDALERLIIKQDKLGEQYAYTEDKAEAYKKVIDNLDLSLNENGEAADKAGRKNAGLGSRFAGLRNMLSGLRSHFNLFGNSAEQAGNRARNGFNRGYRSGLNLASIGRRLATQIIVYQLLGRAIMALGSAFFSALKANTQFSASLNQIQVNLLTAFYPVYKTVLPALNALMSALRQATAWIANFTAALTGTSVKANQAGAKALYSQVQAMKDTSSASKSATSAIKKQQEEQAKAVRESNAKIQEANRAGRLAVQEENKKIEEANNKAKESYEKQKKAAEDLKNSLMGFDEINVLQKDKSNDNGGYDKQAKKTFTPQATQPVPSVDSDTGDTGAGSGGTGANLLDFSKPISEDGGAFKAAKNFKKLMGELFDPLKEAWASKGQSVIEAAKRAWAELSRAVGDVGQSFKTVWTNGTGQKVVEDLLKLFRTLLNIIGDVGRAFAQAWEDHNRGTNTVQAIFNALHKVLVLLNDIGVSFRKAFNSGVGESIFAHLINYAQNLAKQVGTLAGQFDKAWKAGGTGEDIWKTLLGMVDDYAGYIDKASASWVKFDSNLNFGPILKSFDTLLKSVRSLGKDAFDGLYWNLTNVLQPLSKWTIEKAAPAAVNALAAALKLVHTVIDAAKPALKWAWESFLEPVAKWTGIAVIEGLKLLTSALNGLSSWASKNQKLITDVAKILITWFAFKVSVSAIETAISKFTSLVSVAKDLVGLYWGKLKTAGGYLKTIASLSWDGLKIGVGKLADLAKLGWSNVKLLAGYMGDLIKLGWSKLIDSIQLLGTGLKALWAIMAANPIGAVIAAIGALVAIFATLYATNKPFREWCNGIWGNITKYFGGLGKWFGKKWDDISKGWGEFKVSFGKAWSDGWNGIKEGVTGKDGVWTKIKSGASDMWGNISGSWGTFKTDFKTSWDNHWTGVKNSVKDGSHSGFFNQISSSASSTWGTMKTDVGSFASDFATKWNSHWSSVSSKVGGKHSGIFHDIISGAGGMFSGIKSHMTSWWPDFSKTWGNNWGSIKSKVGGKGSGIFHDIISGAGSMFSGIKSHMASWWPDFSKTWGNHWGSAKGTVTDAFDTLVTKAGHLGGRIADAVKGGWHVITDTFGKLANKIIAPIQSVIKKIGQGINWALKKVGQSGFDWTFDWTFKYANGTGGHPGGLALVNDQEGDTYREAFQLPNGKTGIFPAVRNLLMDLPAGTKVMPAAQTKAMLGDIPHYAGGIGFNWGGWLKSLDSMLSSLSGIGNSISSGFGEVVSTVSDAFDDILSDITHPTKLVNYLIDKFVGANNESASVSSKFWAGTKHTMANNMFKWAKDFLKKFGDADPPGAGVARWRPVVIRALKANGLSTDNGIVNRVLTQMSWESGGNPHARQPGNDPDGDGSGPALGLMQTKRATFAANAFPGHGDLWNGYDDLLAAIHYAKAKYGPSLSFLGTGSRHGYESGGLINKEGYYLVGEGNKPEMVIPLTDKVRALALIQKSMEFMGENFKNGVTMPRGLEQQISFAGNANQGIKTSNDFTTSIVNAIVQGLHMANMGGQTAGNNQPINVTIQVDSTKLGEAAIKGINQVNQANGKNMLRI